MKTYQELSLEAGLLDQQLQQVRKEAQEAYNRELKEKDLADRLIYSAYDRCGCGAGLAYDPLFEDKDSVFVGPLSGYWDCSKILLGTADQTVKHTAQLPFAFYEIKSEIQPSVNGVTTRPSIEKNN
jgi:hypothetical protein